MSDAMSDIARDQRRSDKYEAYLQALLAWLKTPLAIIRKKVIEAAESTDSVRGGYLRTGPSNLMSGLPEFLEKLRNGEKETWSKFLSDLAANRTGMFESFKNLSPFKDRVFVTISYGNGFVRIEGELEEFLSELIREKGHRTHDYDTFALALTRPLVAQDVFWICSAVSGITGPRTAQK